MILLNNSTFRILCHSARFTYLQNISGPTTDVSAGVSPLLVFQIPEAAPQSHVKLIPENDNELVPNM